MWNPRSHISCSKDTRPGTVLRKWIELACLQINQFQDVSGWFLTNWMDKTCQGHSSSLIVCSDTISCRWKLRCNFIYPWKNNALPHGTQNEQINHYNNGFWDLGPPSFTPIMSSSGCFRLTYLGHSRRFRLLRVSSICFRSDATSFSREADLARKVTCLRNLANRHPNRWNPRCLLRQCV